MRARSNWEFQYYMNNRSTSYVRDGNLHLGVRLTEDVIGTRSRAAGRGGRDEMLPTLCVPAASIVAYIRSYACVCVCLLCQRPLRSHACVP